MASSGVTAMLLLALLAFTNNVGADGPTICDTAKCGKGRCSEVPGPIPFVTTSYQCTCEPGWSQPALPILNLTLPSAPCIIPDCPFDPACYNISLVPRGIPLTDPCVAINCGPGECKRGEGWSYTCECQPGYVNFLNLTAFPCVKNCVFGMDCSRLGIAPPAPPPSKAPPPGNHDSSAPPTGPKGSSSSWRLLQLLSLFLLAMVQLV